MKVTSSPIDIDQLLDVPLKSRITAIGIELEGGWDVLPRGVSLTRDSSVQFERPAQLPAPGRQMEIYRTLTTPVSRAALTSGQRAALEQEYYVLDGQREQVRIPAHVGEYPSSPMYIRDKVWETWIRLAYPPHVNATCGMHVHMSFRSNLTYQRLMDPALTATVLAYVRKWAEANLPADHCIFPRLEGKSQYCEHLFHADAQAKVTRKGYDHAGAHRYTVLNYPYSIHQTVECRLLPMMPSVDLAIQAITHLMQIINAFLLVTGKKKEENLIIDLSMEETPLIDHYHVSL